MSLFPCPKCSCTTAVRDARSSVEFGPRRRRACEGCGFRFTTYEQFIDDIPAVRMTSDGRVASSTLPWAGELFDLLGKLEADDVAMIIGVARRLVAGPVEAHDDLRSAA